MLAREEAWSPELSGKFQACLSWNQSGLGSAQMWLRIRPRAMGTVVFEWCWKWKASCGLALCYAVYGLVLFHCDPHCTRSASITDATWVSLFPFFFPSV